jgi:adenine-specific DNA-methyltransferase
MHSPNFTEENIAKLAALFPGCVTESIGEDGNLKKAIDFDQLRQELSTHIVEGPQERYHLNWPGKREALLTANAPIAKTFRPCREESVDFDTTENLFIEGDNLDALKLLQENYLGKVKMIYIDPPYNSGNDFIYEDDFAESSEEFLTRSNQKDAEGNRLVANTNSNGRFHSDWLSMIFSRVKLARNLLSDNGVIFISIDDGEVANLRRLCDEIFGEFNFIAEIVWEGANKNTAQQIGVTHEYAIVYAKSKTSLETDWSIRKEDVGSALREVERLKKKYGTNYSDASTDLAGWFRSMKGKPAFSHRRFRYIDVIGAYKEDDPTAPGGRKFDLLNPKTGNVIPLRRNRGWSFDQEEFNRLVSEGRISFVSETSIMVRRYLHETVTVTPQSVFYQPVRSASERLAKLIGANVFPYPKDEQILKSFVEMATKGQRKAVILDFFAGSATTAHAVMQLNTEDGGRRKFIMVQLPEECDEKSEAFKVGYKTITEIGKERIRRAGKKIKSENPITTQELDVGFRVFKVDSSNMADIYYTPDAVEQKQLSLLTDNIKADRSPEDLLFQVLLDWGVDLTLPITKETVEGREVFFVDNNALAACFVKNGQITEDFCKELTKRQPLRVVFRDSGFKDDSVKINVEQIFKLMSPHTEVKCI